MQANTGPDSLSGTCMQRAPRHLYRQMGDLVMNRRKDSPSSSRAQLVGWVVALAGLVYLITERGRIREAGLDAGLEHMTAA
nr:hypothetical protein [Kibdelosporangium sp. MJ126-NF4]CTQ95876.1 hypothetical protein [Kibdelosporangium sp. MJ126-NF4]